MLDDREVVADEQQRQAELVLQIGQQVDDLRLHRHVERRDRLVADDQVGARRQRARDADALALPAGELVRIAADRVARQAAPCPAAARRARSARARAPMPKLISGSARMSRTFMRGLSDENGSWNTTCTRRRSGRSWPAGRLSMRSPSSCTSPAVVGYSRRIALPDGRFAAAGLAHQRQRLAARDVERHAIDRVDLRRSPARGCRRGSAKCFFRLVTSSSGGHRTPSRMPPRTFGVVARRRCGTGQMLLDRRAHATAQSVAIGQRPAKEQPTIGCRSAGHQSGDLGQPPRPPATSDDPSFGTAPSKPRV